MARKRTRREEEPIKKVAKKVAKKAARKVARAAPVRKTPSDLEEMSAENIKLHGENVISVGAKIPRANHIPTGCFILDFGLLGGYAQGYIGLVYGYHSTGKSTNLLRAVAEFQKKHPTKYVGWVDAEGMYDPDWSERHGVDQDRVVLAQPDYGELAVDIIEDLMERDSIGMIIVDSIPHMVPHKMIENSAEDDTMAALARLMSKMSSKLTMANNRERRKGHWVTVLLVNQFRSKVGFVMGDTRTLPGGVQINHIPTTKIEFKRKKAHLGKDRYGNEVADFDECGFKFEKVKHGQSIRSGEYQMYLNPDNDLGLPAGAIDNFSTISTFAKRMKFITGAGKYWRLQTENLEKKYDALLEAEEIEEGDEVDLTVFSSLDQIRAYLQENPEEYETLSKSLIAEQRRIKGLPPIPPDGFLISHRARYVTLPDSTDSE